MVKNMKKKIENIVFYKFSEENSDVQACFFYHDGTVENTTYDVAIKEAKWIAFQEKAIDKDAFSSLVNSKRIYVMSGEELNRRFNEFIVRDDVKDIIDDALNKINFVDNEEIIKDESKSTNTIVFNEKEVNNLQKVKTTKEINDIEDVLETEEEIGIKTRRPLVKERDEDFYAFDHALKNSSYAIPVVNLKDEIEEDEIEEDEIEEAYNEESDTEVKETAFTKVKKFAHGKLFPVAVALTLVAGVSLPGFALNKTSKEGVMNDTKAAMSQPAESDGNNDEVVVNYANNDYYNNYTFNELLEVTTNPVQKEVMENTSIALDWYNGEFADYYVEKGKDIRAALTWDEMIALQMAYNDYSKQDIHAIFNGAEISSNDLENAYKNATLQLMGAYVIEEEGHLVDVSKFVHDEEGIAFVQKYQNLFEAAKNAEGDEKVAAVEAFYRELYKDFPITEEIRTEGISHADHRTIESYKLAVAPIVAAAEIMFQNLEIDATLTDPAIEYFNDLGLCNLAQDKFDRIETITLACCEYDEENPLYEQFRTAKIKELKKKGIYVIDDAHRDLSQLDRFQELVNWHFQMVDGYFDLETWYTTETYTTSESYTVSTTNTWTESETTKTSDRNKAVELAGEQKVREAEDRVDQQIERDNQRSKEQGEKEAAKNQEKMQREADKHKEELEKEVKQDAKDLQEDIKNANDKIDHGQTVNESDFNEHNVDFDNEHSDGKGNLDNSVKDISTDGTGADKELPDPSKTGAAFDKEADHPIDVTPEYDVVYDDEIDRTETPSNTDSTNNGETTVEDNINTSDNNYDVSDSVVDLGDPNDIGDSFDAVTSDFEDEYEIVYDDEIDYATEPTTGTTPKAYEELVNEYVEKQATESTEVEADKALVK